MTLAWFMASSQSPTALAELTSRLLSVVFLGTALLVLSDARVHGTTRWSILWAVLLGVGLNVYDLGHPLTFGPSLGRAAGLYLNPNISGAALVLGMIMSVELVPQWWRSWYVSLVGVGVLLTFSRAGMAAWVVATGLIAGLGAMRLLQLLRVTSAIAAIVVGALVVSGRWETGVQMLSQVSSDAWGRLRLGEGTADPSAELRLKAASMAWQMFLSRPLVGHGVGATVEWDLSESTHNIYLRHLAEYGIGGLVIVPLLLLALLWRGSGPPVPHIAVWLAGVLLLFGVFSHNILDERHFLICVALVASVSAANRLGETPDTFRGSRSGVAPSVGRELGHRTP